MSTDPGRPAIAILTLALSLTTVPAGSAIGIVDVPDLITAPPDRDNVPAPAILPDPSVSPALAAALDTDLSLAAPSQEALSLASPYDRCDPHQPIRITENHGRQGFTWTNPVTGEEEHRPGNGVVAGNGSAENPYTIQGWCIAPNLQEGRGQGPWSAGITIRDTSAHVLIEDTIVDGQPVSQAPAFDRRQAVGIQITDANHVTVQNSTIQDNDDGIVVNEGDQARLVGNDVLHNGDGISVSASNAVEIQANTIDNEADGVSLSDASQARIADNTITGNEDGIKLDQPDGAQIVANTLADNEQGVYGTAASGTHIDENTITDNDDGIDLRASTGTRIANNTIADNRFDGVELYRSTGAQIENNTITGSVLGVLLVESSHARIGHNNIHGNSNAGVASWMETKPVDATQNWWGADDGPTGPVDDACSEEAVDGAGDGISLISGGEICIRPWRTSPKPHAGAG